MRYRVKTDSDLLDAADGNFRDAMAPNQIVIGTGNLSGDFVEVKTTRKPEKTEDTGWAHKDDIEPAPREVFNIAAFVRECLIAERSFNDLDTIESWFVLADYLIARAQIEAGAALENPGKKLNDSDAVGPLQVSTAEWKAFLASNSPLKEGLDKDDFDDYLAQVWGAAYTMHADAKAISKVKRDAGLGSDQEPPLPSYLEVHLAYLTGSAKAADALATGTETPADKGNDPAAAGAQTGAESATKLNNFLKSKGGMTDAEIATLFGRRAALTGTDNDNAKTVGEFVGAVTTALNTALKSAFELIKTHAPETVMPLAAGGAPWLTVAEKELAKHIKEGDAAGDTRIAEYFASIGMDETSATPWCAAFVAFCMKDSGNAVAAASVPKQGPALAISWARWGEALPVSAHVPGAIVVLKPTESSDRSGHVGIYRTGDANNVTLLGGNQSDQVKESTYARNRVVAIRWLNLSEATGAPGAAANAKLNALSQQQQAMAKLIMQKFAAAGFGPLQQIAAVANAQKESSLNPSKRNRTAREDSIGLFQLNTKGGLGHGRDPNDLLNPEINIDITIKKALKVASYRRAATLREAVAAFVEFVEIPANIPAEIEDRLAKAKALQA